MLESSIVDNVVYLEIGRLFEVRRDLFEIATNFLGRHVELRLV